MKKVLVNFGWSSKNFGTSIVAFDWWLDVKLVVWRKGNSNLGIWAPDMYQENYWTVLNNFKFWYMEREKLGEPAVCFWVCFPLPTSLANRFSSIFCVNFLDTIILLDTIIQWFFPSILFLNIPSNIISKSVVRHSWYGTLRTPSFWIIPLHVIIISRIFFSGMGKRIWGMMSLQKSYMSRIGNIPRKWVFCHPYNPMNIYLQLQPNLLQSKQQYNQQTW